MKKNVLNLTAAGFFIALVTAGCGKGNTPDPVEEAKKGAALAADANRAAIERSQQQRPPADGGLTSNRIGSSATPERR